MINSKQAARLKYLVNQLCDAVRADEMKGAQRVEHMAEIEIELLHARNAMTQFVVSITRPKDTVALPVSVEQAEAMRDVAEGYLKRRRK